MKVSTLSKASSIANALINAPAANPRTQASLRSESRAYRPKAAPISDEEVVANPRRQAAKRESKPTSDIASPVYPTTIFATRLQH
jgi:hypothetical protein